MILGVELREDAVIAVVTDDRGVIAARGRRDGASGSSAADAVRDAIAGASISAIGIAVRDPLDTSNAEPIAAATAAAGGSASPRILTRGCAVALGEHWMGVAQGAKHVVALTAADCVHAGLIIDGRPFEGAHGVAGAAAWLALNPVEREDYRKFGCLEAEIGAAGIVRRLVWRIKSGDQSRVLDMAGGDLAAITVQQIFDAARAGDGVAISVVRDTARYVGMAVANLVAITDPNVVILGGLIADAADQLMQPSQAEALRRLPRTMAGSLTVASAMLGEDGGPLGAARAAMLPPMIVLAGGDIVLPDRILTNASLIIDQGRIAAIDTTRGVPPGASIVDVRDRFVVPGFIDVHVHGIEGHDTLDAGDAVAAVASRLPQYGVTAFCPTTVACGPVELRAVLAQIARVRVSRPRGSARVLPAHLESNFINPDYNGAQPRECLRLPNDEPGDGDFTGRDILKVIELGRADVGIITIAPEVPGALDLVPDLVRAGHRVSLGHSGADFGQAVAAIDAGARHATHLFNRMIPMTHRVPGLVGAVLSHDEVTAELICDGFHVHPAICRVAIAAKGIHGVMAITDGTGGSGLTPGSTARLGGRTIRVSDHAALLDDGTLAGSTLTMDRAFRNIVTLFNASIAEAAILCSTTPARALGLTGFGVIADGGPADLVVLDRAFRVARTFIDGEEVYCAA